MQGATRNLFLLAVALLSVAAASQNVHVIKDAPVLKIRTFDPANKPAEMPALHGSENAVCNSRFGVTCAFQGRPVDEHREGDEYVSGIQVVSVTVHISLEVTQWIPEGGDEAIRAHEAAHSRISQQHYATASDAARRIAEPFIGRTLIGKGPTRDAARRAAAEKGSREICNAYIAAVQKPSSRVNDLFDQITNHGRKPISVEKAVDEAYQAYIKEMGG